MIQSVVVVVFFSYSRSVCVLLFYWWHGNHCGKLLITPHLSLEMDNKPKEMGNESDCHIIISQQKIPAAATLFYQYQAD